MLGIQGYQLQAARRMDNGDTAGVKRNQIFGLLGGKLVKIASTQQVDSPQNRFTTRFEGEAKILLYFLYFKQTKNTHTRYAQV
jgi:hypothetical protein